MKNIFKKIIAIALLILSVNAFISSKEQEKTLLELNKEVLSLKYELYQMENKKGDYAEMSDFKIFFEKAKKERLLKKREAELMQRNEVNKEEAKKAFEQAQKELSNSLEGASKDFEKLGKDLEKAFSDFFND